MSTYLKTANLDSSILSYKIVEDIRLDQTAITDVTQSDGTLYSIEIDASAANQNQTQYLKLKLQTGDVTVGTTPPDIMIECVAQQITTVNFPSGVAFTTLSAWLTSSNADAATTNTEAAAGRYTIVRFVTN